VQVHDGIVVLRGVRERVIYSETGRSGSAKWVCFVKHPVLDHRDLTAGNIDATRSDLTARAATEASCFSVTCLDPVIGDSPGVDPLFYHKGDLGGIQGWRTAKLCGASLLWYAADVSAPNRQLTDLRQHCVAREHGRLLPVATKSVRKENSNEE